VEQDNNFNRNGVFSKRIRAGRRRTYFFDVRTTRSNDYYLTITESKRRFNEDGYERHKLHLYKEDFNKFIDALQETIDHVKSELMPEYDFDEYTRKDEDNHYQSYNYNNGNEQKAETETETEDATTTDTTVESADTGVPPVVEDEEDLKWD